MMLLHLAPSVWTKRADGNLPSIFILGAQKGGSSSLFEFLMEHPILCQGEHKEPHFFDGWQLYGWKTGNIPERRAYMALFPDDPNCKKHSQQRTSPFRYVDATTMLHVLGTISKRMYEFYTPSERNSLRFVVVLRDPVARDFSWYQQVCRDQLGGNLAQRSGGGEKPLPFNKMETMREAEAHHARHIKRSGRYVEQLGNFTSYFRRDQVFIVSSQMLFRNTSTVMHSLASFLDIEFVKTWEGQLPHDNHLDRKQWADIVECLVAHIPKLDCSFRQDLADYYAPHNELLYQWLESTRPAASPFEPPFLKFGNDYLGVPCVDDARKEYNELIAANPGEMCEREEQRHLRLRLV